MLLSLHINNYVLIDELRLVLPNGFSVITGETGAGKSILLGALALLTGKRADSKTIFPEAKKCIVEAVFDIENLCIEDFFSTHDIDFDGKECIIRREITSAGKSRAFVNDTPVSLTTLRTLTSTLVDIHSQHQNLMMGDERFLLRVLEGYADNASRFSDYQRDYQAWTLCTKELKALEEEAAHHANEAEYMQFQLAQLDEARLKKDELEELEEEQEKLAHSEEIKEALYHVSTHLTSEQTNILGALRIDAHQLGSITAFFPQAAALEERVESARIELEDIASEAEDLAESLDFNPQRLLEVEERLALIYGLLKKHHKTTVAELIAYSDELRSKLSRVENLDDLITAKRKEIETAYTTMLQSAKRLTAGRKEAAQVLTQRMLQFTTVLGMPAARLEMRFTEKAPSTYGQDEISLLFSANDGLKLQNVADIASGGEIARLMLALKAAVAEHQALPTIIFDEIDTGVSGRMADAMAQVMDAMSKHCQVLCITHLPQIAAAGSTHFKVYKEAKEGITQTRITRLTDEARQHEIATMLSGHAVTEAAISNAQELLHAAQQN